MGSAFDGEWPINKRGADLAPGISQKFNYQSQMSNGCWTGMNHSVYYHPPTDPDAKIWIGPDRIPTNTDYPSEIFCVTCN
jgi:hypothetical protein